MVPKQLLTGTLNMNKATLKFAIATSALVFSASTMAVGLGVNAGVGVNAKMPGMSVDADAKADAKANANADLKGKSSAAVKGAKSQGDEMRNEAGALHSEVKGEAGKRTDQLKSASDVNANADVKAEAKASGKMKAEKK
ncbi:MAG: hypothetical protein KJ798_06755 [Gammaproteobacteria bacterium]|uniref:hypothetical protein n=1 Tax=Limnobacter sp. TaxID=2003368 RepID=UPI001E10F68D|nr:hypothetical protein [Limnobacter sp.]MBU1529679.1 hypothetical protein [Gammaproteobacteria bacterium]MBU1780070.1 hypothetical protein [Gammaproteobacteria bacterium]MBU2211743.1 hypothetical protein [Gammaproteobacteria bacterium]MDP3189674.1 hypothetical protein [Limnobacter sp.]